MANAIKSTIPVFKINGNTLPNPSGFKWELPKTWGYDGTGQERLFPFTSVELSWGLLTFADYTTLYDVYRGSISGSSSANLPSFYGTGFSYGAYSNVVIDPPRIEGSSIDGSNVTNVKMKIRRITVSRT